MAPGWQIAPEKTRLWSLVDPLPDIGNPGSDRFSSSWMDCWQFVEVTLLTGLGEPNYSIPIRTIEPYPNRQTLLIDPGSKHSQRVTYPHQAAWRSRDLAASHRKDYEKAEREIRAREVKVEKALAAVAATVPAQPKQ